MEPSRAYRVSPALGGIELLRGVYRGHRWAPHAQDSLVIGVARSGEAMVCCRGVALRLTKGSVLVIPPRLLHEAANVGNALWQYDAMYPSATLVAALAGDSPAGQVLLGDEAYVIHSEELTAQVLSVHDRLWHAASAEEGEAERVGAMRAMLHEIGKQRAQTTDWSEGRAERRLASAVAAVRQEIDADPMTRRSLNHMASMARVSRFAFAHAFTRAYGVSPHAYVLQRRISTVREMLAGGEKLSRAAHEVGFVDQSHLTRRFLSVVGVTPGEYRRAWRSSLG